MGKFRGRKGTTPPLAAQIFSAFVFAGALALAFAAEFSGQTHNGASTVPDLNNRNSEATASFQQVHARWKRSLAGDLLDTADALGIGGSYLRKFKALLEGTPPTVREAFLEGDFSNVTENDIRGMNVSVLEYVPPKLFEKMTKSASGMSLLTPIIEKFLDFNRPNALGRLMSVAGDKLDANTLLSKVKEHGGAEGDQKNEAASVLLYNALNKLGDSNQITSTNLRSLLNDNLLQLVPEEQLMKVKDSAAAKFLLNRYYAKASGNEHDDVDDKALIYQLANAAYGKAESWTTDTIADLERTPQILAQLPSAALKNLNADVVSQSISKLSSIKFENPLQGKSVAEIFMEKAGFKKDEDGNMPLGEDQQLAPLISSLGSLAAFVNPSMTNSPSLLGSIINSCDQLNLPAPFEAVKNFIKSKAGGKKLESLEIGDIKDIGISVLKNGPPQLMNTAMETGALSNGDLKDIGNVRSDSGGIFNSFLKGLISQVAAYAVKQFTKSDGSGIDFGNLPGAFMGALGLRGLNNVNNRELDDIAEQLRKNPDSLDDSQKALLLKKFKDAGLLDDVKKLPPEIRALLPRKTDYDLPDGILDGLPADAELRLAHGNGKQITASALAADPHLVGTLTPKQVSEIDISEIPAVLAAVRKSKDGPQPQALKALSVRFKEYIQLKSEDYETPDKKLLKHITAAEVSKLPATVLAYFVDPRQTSKLPADVRKEILIALGELSTKDHASIPTKTREEIILQGLKAIDEKLDAEKKLGVPELAAIGGGVVDLPPERIEQLSPVAFEQALEIVQGTADDDDDGLKLRPCLNPEQKKAWRDKIQKTYGRLETWDPATVTSLCCSLALFEEDDLHSIPKENILTCRCLSDEEAPSHLKDLKKSLYANCKHEVGIDQTAHKLALEKVKTEADFDMDDLESQIITRRKREADEPLTCYAVRIIGSTKPFDKERLESIQDKDIPNCLYDLGKDPLNPDVARSLWEKLVRNKGGIENLASTDYLFAGHILSGIRQEDVGKLDLADPDIVSSLGESLGFSKSMLEKLATQLEEKSGKSLQEYSAMDLVSAKNILCGFTPEKLRQIQSDPFLEALPVLKSSIDKNCELNRMASLAAIAVRPDVLGDPRNWTSADVRGAGILINGVQDITRVPPEAFLGVTSAVAESLPENILNNLSPEQAGYLPRFSAQSLSEEQISFLSADAHQALDLQGPLVTGAAPMNTRYSAKTCYTFAFIAILASRFL